ncbi:thermostable carboxypeptidase 1 [Vibrio mediterranei AK1]|nr:thermostable carboxypeptidase 1 [Vibrio mediterranei AK1]
MTTEFTLFHTKNPIKVMSVHEGDGAFGYFPSYTLGAMYAAQFMAAMRKEVDVDNAISSLELAPIFDWLSDNIWSQASTLATGELVKQATGSELNAQFFRTHLEKRYL